MDRRAVLNVMESHAIMITLKTGRNFLTELVRDASKHVMACQLPLWINRSLFHAFMIRIIKITVIRLTLIIAYFF